jgi:hypothetical protein
MVLAVFFRDVGALCNRTARSLMRKSDSKRRKRAPAAPFMKR